MLQYGNPGKKIVTYRYAAGVFVQTKIIPLIADLPAARETGGFLSHAATCYCWFCKCEIGDIENLDINSWILRTGAEVLEQAQAWRNLTTISAKKKFSTETGIRWSSLHRLTDRDPVLHTILGFMHNWLEGILQHQLRKLWGIGRDDKTQDEVKTSTKDIWENLSESDLSESADELQALHKEAENAESSNVSLAPSISDSSSESSNGSSTPRGTPAPALNIYMDMSDDDSEDLDYVFTVTQDSFDFTDVELKKIHACIKDISLPTWVARPPINLGEKGHGKLKADQYLILFTVIFPLILPEIWSDPDPDSLATSMLKSFYELVSATNIVASFTTSNAEAERFTQHYVEYRRSIRTLYTDFGSLPNHHFAMHYEPYMKYWGPLPGLSEFPGERVNGMLQKIKTNRHLCE